MKSVAPITRPSVRFREITKKVSSAALIEKVFTDTDIKCPDPLTHHWRNVENLCMIDPPGIALVSKKGDVTIIKWPTDEEIGDIVLKSPTLYHIEIKRHGFTCTYAFRLY